MVHMNVAKSLLSAPLQDEIPSDRDQSGYHPLYRFALEPTRIYQQQFADMYFLRLAKIKPAVDRVAAGLFGDVVVGGSHARKVERVLDVRQGELCWVSGTIYMDMPYKPNVLDDVSKDKLLSRPPVIRKYVPEDDDDVLAEGRGSVAILLEDDSGRIRLVGRALRTVLLVTGCIVAVMGTENEDGELEVLDIAFPDLPPQPARWAVSNETEPPVKRAKTEAVDTRIKGSHDSKASKKIAIVSGLNFSGPHKASAVQTNLLLEFLLGESVAAGDAIQISRLIIAGNSIAASDSQETADDQAETAKTVNPAEALSKRYGYDSSSYNPQPSRYLDAFVAELLPSMPVTLMPGMYDIANASIPQQPIHLAMFPKARLFASATAGAAKSNKVSGGGGSSGWFDPVTNPWEGEVEGWRVLGTSGQTLDDIAKYIHGDDRLGMMEATCRWRCCAPTAPDTLWSYPYQEDDPFVIDDCPHVYFSGSQPAFGTRVITGPEGQNVRLIAVPAFSETCEVVLLDTETLDVSVVRVARE
ncbi:DNA polymerase delta small subunit Cdc1 [Sporothrix epigloea]|uniref:DNA polymerase delta small subunit Cdc1 n=1 Tax=Sporothrix epigloea TaxID=1892477 RepID=A0ABP0E1B3_9PEZI